MVNDPQERSSLAYGSDTSEALRWVLGQLQKIEQHWTEQVQNQQRRIAAILAVNGFLLAFLAPAGFQITMKPERGWYLYPFYACLVLLALALVFGVLALFPQIPIAGDRSNPEGARRRLKEWLRSTFFPPKPRKFAANHLWLDARAVWTQFKGLSTPEDLDIFLRRLCESVAGNAEGNLEHSQKEVRRRKWMNWQLGLIMPSLLSLIVAVVGWAVHVH